MELFKSFLLLPRVLGIADQRIVSLECLLPSLALYNSCGHGPLAKCSISSRLPSICYSCHALAAVSGTHALSSYAFEAFSYRNKTNFIGLKRQGKLLLFKKGKKPSADILVLGNTVVQGRVGLFSYEEEFSRSHYFDFFYAIMNSTELYQFQGNNSFWS